MRISDWSSDVCSSDLVRDRSCVPDRQDCRTLNLTAAPPQPESEQDHQGQPQPGRQYDDAPRQPADLSGVDGIEHVQRPGLDRHGKGIGSRSEEHTSELQYLMRISYAALCLKKKNTNKVLIMNNNIINA